MKQEKMDGSGELRTGNLKLARDQQAISSGTVPKITDWSPSLPHFDLVEVLPDLEPQPFHYSTSARVTRFKDGHRALKSTVDDRELRLTRAAGDCAVKILGRVLIRDTLGQIYQHGIIMPLEKPLDRKSLDPSERKRLAEQIIPLVHRLHECYGIVHGDIKTDNMLIRSDGRLCLCDFGEARPIDEDPQEWDGKTTQNYEAPTRSSHQHPTVIDDLYAMALSIWTLYSGEHPFENVYIDDIVAALARGETVDISLISDLDIRQTVAGYLRLGGAKI